MNTAEKIISEMTALKDETQRKNLMRFFKTGKGEYGEGDEFLGLRCPETREIVKKYYKETSLEDVEILVKNSFHEIRLCGFLILVEKYAKVKDKNPMKKILKRDEIIRLYLKNSDIFCRNFSFAQNYLLNGCCLRLFKPLGLHHYLCIFAVKICDTVLKSLRFDERFDSTLAFDEL